MGCITGCLAIICYPFIGLFCFWLMILAIFWEIIKVAVKTIIWIISFIFVLIFQMIFKNNTSYEFDNGYNWSKEHNTKKKTVKKYKNKSYKDLEFDEDADLWGLSGEDRKLAKEERMSPADFIEAEERDDDELVTDEWE